MGFRVLVMEDDDCMRDMVVTWITYVATLKEVKVKVTAVASVEEAIQKLRSYDWDMIVTDLMIEGKPLNGMDLIRAIRNDDLFVGTPIVLLTSMDPSLVLLVALSELQVEHVQKEGDSFKRLRRILETIFQGPVSDHAEAVAGSAS